MSGAFVGQARRDIVDELVGAFRAVQAGEGSQVVTIVSQPGWGKTRIVQEFYRSIAAQQSQPPYWPGAMVDGDDAVAEGIRGLSRSRKVVYPSHVTVSGAAQMDWMWWGVSCHMRGHGQLAQAMFDDATQLYAHAQGLMATPTTKLRGRAFDVGSNVIGVLGLLGLAVAPPVGAGITLVGAAKVGWDNLDLAKRLRQWLRDKRGGQDERIVAAAGLGAREHEIDQLVDGLGRVTQAHPMVLVVDDAHFGDEGLVHIVDGLARRGDSRVLVVATAWPSYMDRTEDALPFARWAGAFAHEQPDRYRRVDLVELVEGDVEQVVAAELPSAAGLATNIRELYGPNLLAIRAVLRLPRVQRAAGQGELTVDALARLPRDVEGVFAEHWAGLPETLQVVLALAAQSRGIRYLPDVVATACETRAIVEAARQRLSEGVHPYAWVREIDDSLHSFIEPVLHQIALDRADEILAAADIAALHTAIVDAALAGAISGRSSAAVEEILEQHVALVEAGLASQGESAACSADHLARIHAERYAYWRAIQLAQRSIAWADTDASDAPDTLATRSNLAFWLGEAGRVEDAARQSEELLADQLRVLGQDHPDTLATRGNLAFWLGRAGRVEDAARQFEELLADQLRVLGADHPDILTTRNNLASSLGEAGRVENAARQFEELLADRVRVLGQDHPDTLATRSNLAYWLGEAGRVEDAARQFEELLADLLRVLGQDHPDTLATRNNLAYWLGEAGRVEDAARQFEELLADLLRVLGQDHPDTLATRNNLAYWLGEAGRVEDAARQFEELLPDCVRVLGPDHPLTSAVRQRLSDGTS